MDGQTPFEQLQEPGGVYLVCGTRGEGVQVLRRSALPPTHVLLIPQLSCKRRRSTAARLAHTGS